MNIIVELVAFTMDCIKLMSLTVCMLGYIEYTHAKAPKDPVTFIKKKIDQFNPLNVLGDDFEIDFSSGAQTTQPSSNRSNAATSSSVSQDEGFWDFSVASKTAQAKNKPLPKVPTKKIPWVHINMGVLKQDIPKLDAFYKKHMFDLDRILGRTLKTTLLHGALEHSKYKAAIWLLKKGASISVKNKEGKNCWEIFVAQYKIKKLKQPYTQATSKSAQSTDPFEYYFASALEQVQKEQLTHLMISRGKDPL